MKNVELHKVSCLIINNLLDLGFIIQRYDAYSSSSVYIKLDYGVGYSIRISNHKGKSKLRYRYNIGSDIGKYKVEIADGLERFYFPLDEVDMFIDRILLDKQNRMKKYGEFNYIKFMEKNKEEKSGEKGFWKQAVEIKKKYV